MRSRLALEVSRLAFRSRVRGAVMLGVVAAGWVAHSAFLYYRALRSTGSPLSSRQDWLLLAAWLLVMVYFYLTYYHPRAHFGVFSAAAGAGTDRLGCADGRFPAPGPRSVVKSMGHYPRHVDPAGHGVGAGGLRGRRNVSRPGPAAETQAAGLGGPSARAASGSTGSSGAGLARRLAPLLPEGLKLPSLEWLQTVNSRCFVISLWMLGIGLGSGIVLDVIDYRSHLPVLPWNDPLVLGTLRVVPVAPVSPAAKRRVPAHPPWAPGGVSDRGQFPVPGPRSGDGLLPEDPTRPAAGRTGGRRDRWAGAQVAGDRLIFRPVALSRSADA